MKVAAKVLTIINLIAALILIFIGMVVVGQSKGYSNEGAGQFLWLFFGYGGYALLSSIAVLTVLSRSSKLAVNIAAGFYIPVSPLVSVFLFLIKEGDLYFS